MKTYRIHLIRHALTQDNLTGVYTGRKDTPLSDEGKEQLKAIVDDYVYPEVDFVFSSPLSRCKETAEIIYPDKKSIIIDDLTEYDFGEFEGQTADVLHEKQPLFDKWLRGEKGVKPPFGESNEDFANRVCSCFCKIVDGIIKTGADDTAIITHGGVISTILANFGIPELPVTEWITPSCCGYTIAISHFLWMSGKKVEVIKEIPTNPNEETKGNYYDGWDYYPNDDDFDISEYLADFND